MYTVWESSRDSLSGPVPVFVVLWPYRPWPGCCLSIHSCRNRFFSIFRIFIIIFGNNKSPGYFLVVCIIWGWKKLFIDISTWSKDESDVSFDYVCAQWKYTEQNPCPPNYETFILVFSLPKLKIWCMFIQLSFILSTNVLSTLGEQHWKNHCNASSNCTTDLKII